MLLQNLYMEEHNKQEEHETVDEESIQPFLQWLGVSEKLPEFIISDDFLSHIVGRALTVYNISRGHVTCSFTVKPYLTDLGKMEEPKKQGDDEISNEESTHQFFQGLGISENLPDFTNSNDFYSHLIAGSLTVDHISRGHLTCSFTVKPCLANFYNGLHGGVVAAVAERLAIGCARTVVGEDKHLFLGELSISYLSAATINAEVIAEASLVRSGRNLSVVSIELKLKQTAKLVYTAHATFYHLPASKL